MKAQNNGLISLGNPCSYVQGFALIHNSYIYWEQSYSTDKQMRDTYIDRKYGSKMKIVFNL